MSRREEFSRVTQHHSEQRAKSQRGDFKPKVGTNVVRILPNWADGGKTERVFYKKFRRHFSVGPEKRWVICRRSQNPNESCPICEHIEELRKSGVKEDVALAKEMFPRERFAMNIVDMNDVGKGVQVWEVGSNVIDSILAIFNTDDYEDLDSLETGRSITVTRVGEGKNDTKYTVVPAGKPTSISVKIMEKVNNLDLVCAIPSVEDGISALKSGEAPEEEDREMAALVGGQAQEPDGEDEGKGLNGTEEADLSALGISEDDKPKAATAAKTRAEILAGLKPKK